jgi:hypothetical protein
MNSLMRIQQLHKFHVQLKEQERSANLEEELRCAVYKMDRTLRR